MSEENPLAGLPESEQILRGTMLAVTYDALENADGERRVLYERLHEMLLDPDSTADERDEVLDALAELYDTDDARASFRERVETAEHPGPIPSPEEMMAQSEASAAWYEATPWYAARVYYEAALENERLADKLRTIYEGDANDEIWGIHEVTAEADPEAQAEIDSLGLSMMQGGTATQRAGRLLVEDQEVRDDA